MTARYRVRRIGLALAVAAGCVPLAAIVTITSAPAWAWFEQYSGLESYGHSGPAGWCYGVSYGLLLAGGLRLALRRASAARSSGR
ncbi:MAG: hypothetical protein KDH15_16360 [Rhodocyclaceae bacterium]|nr:hypothetical protein [Rhodocyclaceae bacterium]